MRVLCSVQWLAATLLLSGPAWGKTLIPQQVTLCGGDDQLIQSHLEQKQGEGDGVQLTGFVASPFEMDASFSAVLTVYLAYGDGWYEEPMVLNMPDPCNLMSQMVPDIVKQMAAVVDAEPACPVPAGNYTFQDNSFKMTFDSPLLAPGKYKMILEFYKDDKKASCVEIIFKLTDD